jgi:hypothetical protein
VKSANGVGEEEKIATPGPNSAALCWSRDGNTIFYQAFDGGMSNIMAVDLHGDRKPRTVITTKFIAGRAQLSPDGHWLAYQSDESGRPEVYVVSYTGGAGKWQISTSGGIEPCWSRDGNELFSPQQRRAPHDRADAGRRLVQPRESPGVVPRGHRAEPAPQCLLPLGGREEVPVPGSGGTERDADDRARQLAGKPAGGSSLRAALGLEDYR